jgi:hypothetical protein
MVGIVGGPISDEKKLSLLKLPVFCLQLQAKRNLQLYQRKGYSKLQSDC